MNKLNVNDKMDYFKLRNQYSCFINNNQTTIKTNNDDKCEIKIYLNNLVISVNAK